MPQFQAQKNRLCEYIKYRLDSDYIDKKDLDDKSKKKKDEEMIAAIVVASWLEERTVSEAARQTSSVSEQERES